MVDNLIVPVWWSYLLRSIFFYLAAWGISRLSRRLAGWLIQPIKSKYISPHYTPERQAALQGLIASSISVLMFVLATVLTLGQFIDTNTLIWMIGLFSAAFGLGGGLLQKRSQWKWLLLGLKPGGVMIQIMRRQWA